MKKVIVLLSPKYGMTEEEISDYISRREEMCHKVEQKLDEYCELSYLNSYSLRETEDKEYLRRVFIRENLIPLLDSDYAVFEAGCDENEECRLLRHVAEGYGVPILEV